MAARRHYVLNGSRIILQDSRQVSSTCTTEPNLFESKKRKRSDLLSCSDPEPKRSCLQNWSVWLEGETLQRPQKGPSCSISIIGDTKRSDFRKRQRKSSDGCRGETVLNPATTESTRRKATDEGSESEPKRFRRGAERETNSDDKKRRKEEKRLRKEEKRLRKALKRLARARVNDFEQKYEQHEALGQGGFSSVFAGVRISDQQPVAIKHIKREDVAFAPVTVKKEEYSVPAEVLLMTKAAPDVNSVGKNPSVSLLDWYLQDQEQEVVLVMERPTPSESLFNYCMKNAPLPEEQAKVLMRQVVDALVDLHSKGVFHRDIKMENILVQTTKSGPRIRIIDFGCGCDIQAEPYHDYDGTEEYTPPEAFTEKEYHAGPTSVWQIGALLYELLRSDDHKEFTTKLWVRRKLHLSGLSPECLHFLSSCLAWDPNQRISLDHLSHHPWFSLE